MFHKIYPLVFASFAFSVRKILRLLLLIPVPTARLNLNTRFQAQYIATEHGIVFLRNKPLAERAKALISIADPSVREELERAAVKRFGIGFLRLK